MPLDAFRHHNLQSLKPSILVDTSKSCASLILGVYAFRLRRPTPFDGMRVVYRTACN